MKFPHPPTDRNAEKSCRVDHRLIQKIPFFLLKRIGGEGQEGVFQLFHKLRIIRLCQRDNLLISEILIDVGGIDLLRGEVLEIARHGFQVRARVLQRVPGDFLPKKLLVFRDGRIEIGHPEILGQQLGVPGFHLVSGRIIRLKLCFLKHGCQLLQRLADGKLAGEPVHLADGFLD